MARSQQDQANNNNWGQSKNPLPIVGYALTQSIGDFTLTPIIQGSLPFSCTQFHLHNLCNQSSQEPAAPADVQDQNPQTARSKQSLVR
jgi:hypothetical protein